MSSIESWFAGCNRCEYWVIIEEGEFCGRDCPQCYGGQLETRNPDDVALVLVVKEEFE